MRLFKYFVMIKLTLTAGTIEVIDGALEMCYVGLAEQNDPHLKYAASVQNPLLTWVMTKANCTVPCLPEMSIKANSFMPEHIEIEYTTNGFQGRRCGSWWIYHLKNTAAFNLCNCYNWKKTNRNLAM